ncbi:MAG: hypothetical protein AAGA03_00785 [Planctomycetota bacterium]
MLAMTLTFASALQPGLSENVTAGEPDVDSLPPLSLTEPGLIERSSVGSGPNRFPAITESTPQIPSLLTEDVASDRIWLINTRGISSDVCRANLTSPRFTVSRLSCSGRRQPSSMTDYLASLSPDRPRMVYVHGNRMKANDLVARGLEIYRRVSSRRVHPGPVDWVFWSWPSEKQGILVADARVKAKRADTQGLYLAWLLRSHVEYGQPTSLLGFSFGGRVISGALHALAGGRLGGRAVPGEAIQGAGIDAGLIAPAIESHWLSSTGYHRLATKNLDRLVLLYNRRDAVLANYWRISRIRNADALGYTGPTRFALRADGSRLPVLARDFTARIGRHHRELDYYQRSKGGDVTMASLIHGSLIQTR